MPNKSADRSDYMRGMYSDGESVQAWSEQNERYFKGIGKDYLAILTQEGIIPSSQESLDGWVLFSPSANSRYFEILFAKKIDSLAADFEFVEKPKIIAADILGTVKEVGGEPAFIPAFTGATYHGANVDFVSMSADAFHVPLKPNSVDVIWDRLGACWYSLQMDRVDGYPATTELFQEYFRALKPGGMLVLDAGQHLPEGFVTVSTDELLDGILLNGSNSVVAPMDLSKFGTAREYIGAGQARLVVIKKT